jgi:hypothetical protein
MMKNASGASRREFLGAASAAPLAAGGPAPSQTGAPAPFPTVEFGPHRITRLVLGSNPLFGYSHFNRVFDQVMREWMTLERRVETVLRAEQMGIGTWQLHYHRDSIATLRGVREKGGKVQPFLITDFELQQDFSMIPSVAKMGFLGIAHHGGRTDTAFRDGRMASVADFCKRTRDAGVMVGVSTHNPQVIDFIESAGWDVDYYMACFYRVTRTREEARAQLGGEVPLGEVFLENDPARMTKVIRQTKKPCLGFKILAAGRASANRAEVERAFRFAFANIKPNDAVIVGMWPKFKGEIEENAAIVRQLNTT